MSFSAHLPSDSLAAGITCTSYYGLRESMPPANDFDAKARLEEVVVRLHNYKEEESE